MNGIYDTNNDFDFEKVICKYPNQSLGGNYFIKFNVNKLPLYIQPPKCLTKPITKSKKKMFCDLIFSHENTDFINWVEKLDTFCIEQLYENRYKLFETELDKHDIESSFTSSLKVFKSGKYYIIRTSIPSVMEECSLKIYDEDETEHKFEKINEDTHIMTIIEVQGIKCSARNFQVEFEIKQILIMKENVPNIFEKCLLKNNGVKPIHTDGLNENALNVVQPSYPVSYPPHSSLPVPLLDNSHDNNSISCDLGVLQKKDYLPTDILEINLDLDKLSNNETIKLKKRDQVYYEMYREARKKAKIIKKLAISSYLEATRIKNTYMLTEIEDSEDSDYENKDDDEIKYNKEQTS